MKIKYHLIIVNMLVFLVGIVMYDLGSRTGIWFGLALVTVLWGLMWIIGIIPMLIVYKSINS